MNDFPPVSPVTAGLIGRCPRCGRGHIFSGFLQVADRCAVCDLDLSRENVGDGAAPLIMLLVGAFATGFVLWLEFTFQPSTWVYILVVPPIILLPGLALIRPLKGLLIALQYHHRAGDTGKDTFDGED